MSIQLASKGIIEEGEITVSLQCSFNAVLFKATSINGTIIKKTDLNGKIFKSSNLKAVLRCE